MGEGNSRVIDLTRPGLAAQLSRQFKTLGKTGSAEWMAFRNQPARRVRYHASAVSVVTVFDELRGAAFRAQAETFVGDHLVDAEAIVQFDYVDVLGTDPRRRVNIS